MHHLSKLGACHNFLEIKSSLRYHHKVATSMREDRRVNNYTPSDLEIAQVRSKEIWKRHRMVTFLERKFRFSFCLASDEQQLNCIRERAQGHITSIF